jgi:ribosomal protein S20
MKTRAKKWAQNIEIYTAIKSICEALRLTAKQGDDDSFAVNFVSMNQETQKSASGLPIIFDT